MKDFVIRSQFINYNNENISRALKDVDLKGVYLFNSIGKGNRNKITQMRLHKIKDFHHGVRNTRCKSKIMNGMGENICIQHIK